MKVDFKDVSPNGNVFKITVRNTSYSSKVVFSQTVHLNSFSILGALPHTPQGEPFPLTPSIELPNPSILEGLPRRLASPKRFVLRNCQEDEESTARVHSLMLLSWISKKTLSIPVRLPLTLTAYFSSPNSHFASCSNRLLNPMS